MGVCDPGVLAADGRLFCVRLSRLVHRAASARLHLRQGGRHVGFRPAGFGSRARRLGGWIGRPVQSREIAHLGLARQPISQEGHAGAALCTASASIRDVSRSAIVIALGAGICRLARLSVARHRAADQRTRRLHVRPDAPVDAVGHRLLQPPAGQLSRRLGRRPDLRHAGRLRPDVVDLGQPRVSRN
jgi:hypothetical protein